MFGHIIRDESIYSSCFMFCWKHNHYTQMTSEESLHNTWKMPLCIYKNRERKSRFIIHKYIAYLSPMNMIPKVSSHFIHLSVNLTSYKSSLFAYSVDHLQSSVSGLHSQLLLEFSISYLPTTSKIALFFV